ncbi:MAG: MFS transporter [Pseudomonadota bacterium]
MNAQTSLNDLRASLDDAPMSVYQVAVVALAVLIAGLDGYDVSAMSFVAPVVGKAWMIDKAVLGMLLGSSLVGMAGGALLLSPLADVAGRRPMVLTGLLLVTGGTLLSALSQAVWQLSASRVLTGLGIGLMVALTTSIAAEFANKRRRPLAVALTTVGFSLGGVLGGLASSAILKNTDWHWVFGVGAIAGSVLLMVTLAVLPESPAFLIDRRPRRALERLNRVLARFGRAPLAELPPQAVRQRASYRALFAPELAGTTARFAVVFLLVATASYYLLSWLPQLVVDAGFPPSTGGVVMATCQSVGIVASVIFGLIGGRVEPMRLSSIAMICFGLALAVLGFVPPVLTALLVAGSACGFFLSATTAVFYATLTEAFPPRSRVSGIGFVMGFGRLVSGIGPYLAGAMFAAGVGRSGVSLTFAAAAVLAGLLVAAPLLIAPRARVPQ